MNHVNMEVKVLGAAEPKRIITGEGAEYMILEVEVGDETGSMIMVLWDDKIAPLKIGDALKIENGFVTSFKGSWRINVGKYGKITEKI